MIHPDDQPVPAFDNLSLMFPWVFADHKAELLPSCRGPVGASGDCEQEMHAATVYMSDATAVSTRKHARSLFSVPFELRQLTGPAPYPLHAISLDLSQGGLGALVQGNLKVGEAVEADLPLADKTIRLVAVVRYTSALRSGFEFLRLSERDREDITRVIGNA